MQTNSKSMLTGETCLYLYGVIASYSIDGKFESLRGGEDSSEVLLVESGNLACIASRVQLSEYRDRLCHDTSSQLDWLGPRALRHHEILRNLHEITTVVPFKFGTLCGTADEVKQVLQQFQHSFIGLLKHFEGREEWAVRILIDENATLRNLDQTHPQLIRLAESGSNQSPGEIYFQQKRKQKLAAGLVDELVFSLSDCIERRLRECAVEVLRGASSGNGHDKSKLPVLSASLLIEKNCFTTLETILEQVESECSAYALVSEVSGPWPPYSFTDLEGFQRSFY